MTTSEEFFCSGPAELYTLTHWRKMAYRRFETAATAVRFSIERLPAVNLTASVLEVNEERFDHKGIRKLYEALPRSDRRRTDEPGQAAGTPADAQPATAGRRRSEHSSNRTRQPRAG